MPRGRNKYNGKPSLKITDFSDRELLAIARDLADSDGVVDTEYVARQIWPKANRDAEWLYHAKRSIAIRFAWMRRLGLLEKIDVTGQWELTSLAEEFVAGKLKATELMVKTGEMYDSVTDDQAALMRREFQFRVFQRKWK